MARLLAKANASIVVIEEKPDGIFLYEFRDDGFIGDTWHQTIEHAKDQAQQDFGSSVSAWRVVPDSVTDLQAFAHQE